MENTVYVKQCESLKSNPKKWLVTGVAGFIGSHLLERLLELGQEVVGLDNFSEGFQHNIDTVLAMEKSRGRFKLVTGDLRDPSCCEQVCEGIDLILHQGALGSVPRSIANPLPTFESNGRGFVNLLEAARHKGIKRFVYASSSSVYGDELTLPKRESKVGALLSPYAQSKWINEEYASLYTRLYDMECIGLRYFNVFGPRQNPNGAYAAVIPRWFEALRNNNSVVIYGDGETSRDFCYVKNVVQVNLLAALTQNPLACGEAFNVACEERTTLNELFCIVRDLVTHERQNKPIYKDFRAGDIRHSLADVSKARTLLGYIPEVTIREGLALLAKSYSEKE